MAIIIIFLIFMYYLLCVVIWVVTIAVVHYSYLQPVSAELQVKHN